MFTSNCLVNDEHSRERNFSEHFGTDGLTKTTQGSLPIQIIK